MRRSVVFWDFDGTLAVRKAPWPEILRDAVLLVDAANIVAEAALADVLPYGFPNWQPGEQRVFPSAAAWWAAASPTLVQGCLDAGVDLATAERAVREVPRLYYQPDAWLMMPGAFHALSATSRAGWANVILSNHAPELPQLVTALGLDALIERTITSASLGVEKPDPLVFRSALRLADARTDSWMIGDNPVVDIAGARSVGMRALLVHRSAASHVPLSLRDAATRVVTSLGIGS